MWPPEGLEAKSKPFLSLVALVRIIHHSSRKETKAASKVWQFLPQDADPTPAYLATQPLPAYPEQLTVYIHTKTCGDAAGSCVYNGPIRESLYFVNNQAWIHTDDGQLFSTIRERAIKSEEGTGLKYIPLHARTRLNKVYTLYA